MSLQGIERRLEALVEGAFARVFASELRPVELGRRMIREVDANVTIGVRGERIAPNHVAITLAEADYERFSQFGDALASELAQSIEDHAATEKLTLLGPGMIDLLVSGRQRNGQFKVKTSVKSAPRAAAAVGWLEYHDVAVAITEGEHVTLGRLPECEVVIADTNVSRRHAEVRLVDNRARVVDLRSVNGTKLNGRGVPSDDYGFELNDGDIITIGNASIRFTTSRTRGSKRKASGA